MVVITNLKRYARFLWNFLRFSPNITVGIVICLVILVMGFGISLFAPYDPRRWGSTPRNLPPSSDYLLGTTSIGQDVFWFLTYAIRNSMLLGVVGSAIGLVIGTVLGLIAGYKGGIIEKFILLITDTIIVVPTLPILILVSTMIKKQLDMVMLGTIIALLTWGLPVRNVRSMILSLREREFSHVASFSGFKMLNIITSEYTPHVLPWISASFISRINMAIGMEVTLSIFGLSSLQEATLGTMIYWALNYQALLKGLWWWILTPVVTIIFSVLGLFILSVGISEFLNPRIRLHRIMIGEKK